jgi:competence protein ComEC
VIANGSGCGSGPRLRDLSVIKGETHRIQRVLWRFIEFVTRSLRREFDQLPLFAPILLGCGVAAWFIWPIKHVPSANFAVGLLAAPLFGVGLWATGRHRVHADRRLGFVRLLAPAIALTLLGWAAAEVRVWRVATPLWSEQDPRQAVRLSARMSQFQRTMSGVSQIVLDEIHWIQNKDLPRIRRAIVSVPMLTPEEARALLGRKITVTARFFAPPRPVEPGAFDIRRKLFFESVGAFGRAESRPITISETAAISLWRAMKIKIDIARVEIAKNARSAVSGPSGEMIAALLVGDRSGADLRVLQSMRDTNLAHLLAISGMHMAMFSLTFFVFVRLVISVAARPIIGLSPKKIAAVFGLLAATVYLFLSGAGVATQRAYIMIAIAFVAILLDRPVLTLRAVAVAAMIILLLAPESLLEPGFQLSFAATTGLVIAFQSVQRSLRRMTGAQNDTECVSFFQPRLWIVGLIAASFVAGAATAPFAAATFGRITSYGLLANIAATPAMGLWIMPFGVAAVVAAPFGGSEPFLFLMSWGVDYILWIAQSIAAWPAASWRLKAGEVALAWFGLGGAIAVVANGVFLRSLGVVLFCIGLVVWRETPRPDVLIAPGGGMIGVLHAEGRSFDRRKPFAFIAESWLRRDGDAATVAEAAKRHAFTWFTGGAAAHLSNGWRIELSLQTALRAQDIAPFCDAKTIFVVPRARFTDHNGIGDCLVLDKGRLGRTAAAIFIEGPTKIRIKLGDGPPRPWKLD